MNYSEYVPQRPRKSSHRPDGKIADKLALTHACTTANASVNYSMYVPQRPSKVPIARWDFHMCCACACRAAVCTSPVARWPSHRAPSLATQLLLCVLTLKSSHRPHGKIADVLASTHACTTAADAPVNYSMYASQRPRKFPWPRWEN